MTSTPMSARLLSGLSPDKLAEFLPFAALSEEQRIILSHHIDVKSIRAGQRIIGSQHKSQMDIFLLSGAVLLESKEFESRSVAAGDYQSAYGLLQQSESPVDIVALEDTEYFSINLEYLASLSVDASTHALKSPEIHAGSTSHAIVHDFYRALDKGKVKLPSLPELVKKISKIMSDDKLGTSQLSQIISSDPKIAARLMKMANSPFYRGMTEVNHLSEAITRLGTETTRHLVTAFSAQEQQESNYPPWIKRHQLKSWKQSILLGALCFVLAQQSQKFSPEEAMLAGLLHNIGELPLLSFAAQYPELEHDPVGLEYILRDARSRVGALILYRWHLPESIVTAVKHTDTWFYEPYETKATLADVLIVARLFSLTMHENSSLENLPLISQLPSYHKVFSENMDDETSNQVLENAKKQVAEMKALLKR